MRTGMAAGIIAALMGGTALAQDAWVQIEARPTLDEARTRAAAYAADLPDVSGFEMTSSWFVVALGPYPRDDARALLGKLRGEGRIPDDAYLTDGLSYRDRFWPAALPIEVTPPVPRTPEEIETALPPDQKVAVQAALQWFGFYDGALDGEFGAGSRTAMAAWQVAQSHEDTGILTPEERGTLLEGHRRALDEIAAAKGDGLPAPVSLTEDERRAMLAGLSAPHPERTGSGFYVDAAGSVLTSAATVAECGRITLERGIPATVARSDGGLALLRPDATVAPPEVARFAAADAGAEIAVAGYSFDFLPAPALSFGHLVAAGADLRLEVTVLAGDVGGPVLDMHGNVVGMLTPPDDDGRVLPEGIGHAVPAVDLARWLDAPTGGAGEPLTPNALTRKGAGMTVQVSCWR